MSENDSLVHISSAIVSVLPTCRGDVARSLSRMPGVEVFHQSDSKIVIVIEAAESGTIGGRLAEIATFDGVLSANMVFEQVSSTSEFGE